MNRPFSFKQYQPRGLEIIDTTLRDGTQTPLLHDHYKYFSPPKTRSKFCGRLFCMA